MPKRRHTSNLYLVTICAVACWAGTFAVPTQARAYQTEEERWLDGTAYNLRKGEFRLGLLKWSAGVVDQLSLSMYTYPWILFGIYGGVGPNLEAKYMFYDRKGLTLSLSSAFFFGNPESNGVRVRMIDVPSAVTASYRINKTFSVHGSVIGTYANVRGATDSDDTEIQGTLVASNVQLWAAFEARVSRVTSFTLTGHYLPYISDAVVDGQSDVDEVTTIFYDFEFSFDDFKNAWSLVAGANFSWKVVNLHLGVGYGDVFLPGSGLVIPGPYPVPELELYFRF